MTNESYIQKEIPLCGLNDLEDRCAMELIIEERQLFAIRQDKSIFAYWNLCPHRNTPLNWVPNKFLDIENQLIQCALHGALFEIDSGLCILVKIVFNGMRLHLLIVVHTYTTLLINLVVIVFQFYI